MICEGTIDPAVLLARFAAANGDVGAIVSFTGTVRKLQLVTSMLFALQRARYISY